MGVNSLPKTVTRQRRDCDLNPGPSAPESSTLTTRLPSHPVQPCGHCSWQIGSIFIAMLQMYRASSLQITATRLHQIAPNHIKNSKSFLGAIPLDLRRLGARPSDPRPGLGK